MSTLHNLQLLLMGREGSGVLGMRSIVFAQYIARDTRDLGKTLGETGINTIFPVHRQMGFREGCQFIGCMLHPVCSIQRQRLLVKCMCGISNRCLVYYFVGLQSYVCIYVCMMSYVSSCYVSSC